jgi:hypothetical protein
MSPDEGAKLLIYFCAQRIRVFWTVFQDQLFSSFVRSSDVSGGILCRHFLAISDSDLLPWQNSLREASEKILRHEFDLLGSGPVIPGLNFDPPGFEGKTYKLRKKSSINFSNAIASRRLRSGISSEYRPIDWHLDFRSGYRWPSNVSSKRIKYGGLPGVDIKFPWEISRMQHLPLLAITYSDLMGSGDSLAAENISREFQDQILDFISMNPPRFGVNWVCTMDVAIRATNILVAYDIFLSANHIFPIDFQFDLKRAILAHGRHIISNLEWFKELRSNHYLANISGLFFVAAYLPASLETDSWLALASNEMSKEIFDQFQLDGSNFEGSTSYHRLSAEMVLFTVALAYRIKDRLSIIDLRHSLKNLTRHSASNFPESYDVIAINTITSSAVMKHLLRMKSFSELITRPDGKIIQIGDNDSGSFLRFRPYQSLNDVHGESHNTLIDCFDVLFKKEIYKPTSIDGLMIAKLLAKNERPNVNASMGSEKFSNSCSHDFGIYILRSNRFWVSVRCGHVGQNGNGGHAHNDQLSMEFCIDGIPFFVDPGTYVYTSNPESRNFFRSTISHTTLSAEPGEQNKWLPGGEGLFSMIHAAKPCVHAFNAKQFIGEHNGFEAMHRRSVRLEAEELRVIDECKARRRRAHFSLAPDVKVERHINGLILRCKSVECKLHIDSGAIAIKDGWFSPGYGRKIYTKQIEVTDLPEYFLWRITVIAH